MPDAVRLEVPDWLLPHLEPRPNWARALLEPAPLDLRVNLLKATREEAQRGAGRRGPGGRRRRRFSPWGLRIDGRRPVTTGAAFRAGLVEIQDEGSQLVAALVDARPGMRVADLCAGAGGKTLALAMTMQNRGQLVACDVSATRLDGAVRRLRRAGVHNVERHLLAAGDKWLKRRAGSFDRVLVDAPCTGTGTWRRNPDARLRLHRSRPGGTAAQAGGDPRSGCDRWFAPAGVWSTLPAPCSPRRTRPRCLPFSRHPASRSLSCLAGRRRLWRHFLTPARHGTDGFFAAVLERRA